MKDKSEKLPLAICITETKLKEGGCGPPNLSGFGYGMPFSYIRVFDDDHTRHCASGGVSVYISESAGSRRRDDLEQKEVEIVWCGGLEARAASAVPGEKLLLGVLYRSPSDFQGRKQKEQWELIRNNINTAMEKHQEEGPVLVVGDWNLKTLQDKAPNSFEEKELAQLQRKGNNAQESEYDQLVTNLTTTLKDAGMIAFGKRKTVRSVQSWSKQKEVLQAFSKLKEAESELIDDTNNATKKEKMEEARKQFNDIRTEKENDAWNKIRDKIGKEESRKLLHVLLPHSTANLNLLDIQRPDSSLCNSKAEAAELMVEHYANVCSLPDDPSFNSDKKREVEESISNIDRNNDEHDEAENTDLFITEETVSTICRKLNKFSAPGPDDIPPLLLIEGGQPLHRFLAHLFTALLQRGYAPASFRLAHIFPIFKGDKNNRAAPASYRPISLTSVIAKLMERCILPLLRLELLPSSPPLRLGFALASPPSTKSAFPHPGPSSPLNSCLFLPSSFCLTHRLPRSVKGVRSCMGGWPTLQSAKIWSRRKVMVVAQILPQQPLHSCQLPRCDLFCSCNHCWGTTGMCSQPHPLPHLYQRYRWCLFWLSDRSVRRWCGDMADSSCRWQAWARQGAAEQCTERPHNVGFWLAHDLECEEELCRDVPGRDKSGGYCSELCCRQEASAKEGERVTHPLHPLRSRAPCAKQCPLPRYYLRTERSVGCSFRFHPPKGTICSASHLSYHSARTPSHHAPDLWTDQDTSPSDHLLRLSDRPLHKDTGAQAQQPHHSPHQTLPLRIRHHLSCCPLHQLPPSGCRRSVVQECAQLLPSSSQAPRQPCRSTLRRGVGGVRWRPHSRIDSRVHTFLRHQDSRSWREARPRPRPALLLSTAQGSCSSRPAQANGRWAPTFSLPQQFRPRHRASNSPWSSSSGWPSCCYRAPLPPSARQHSPQQSAAQEENESKPQVRTLWATRDNQACHPLLLSIWFCALRPLRCARIPASRQSSHGDLPRSHFRSEAQRTKIYCLWTRFGLVPPRDWPSSSASLTLPFSAQHQWHLLWPFPISLISWAPIHNVCTLYERSSWCLSLLSVYIIHSSCQKKMMRKKRRKVSLMSFALHIPYPPEEKEEERKEEKREEEEAEENKRKKRGRERWWW